MDPFNGSVTENVVDFIQDAAQPTSPCSQFCFNMYRDINRICKQIGEPKKLLDRLCDKLMSCQNLNAVLIAMLDQDEELIYCNKTDPDSLLSDVCEILDDDELPAGYQKSITQLASGLPTLAHGVVDDGEGRIICALRFSETNYGLLCMAYNHQIVEDEYSLIGDIAGEIAFTLHNQKLEKEHRRIEQKAQRDLREKDVLLAEIHHRVKNNLQIISGLLYLQSNKTKDAGAKNVLDESLNRVRSMALIHEQLYQSRDFSQINFRNYVERITRNLTSVYSASNRNVSVDIAIPEIYFNIDTAIPCGLIINELMSNSFKYAFPDKTNPGIISVSLDHKDGYVSIQVKDDGIGMPTDSLHDLGNSCGLEIVKMLAEEQLEGSLFIENHNGVQFTLKFENPGFTF